METKCFSHLNRLECPLPLFMRQAATSVCLVEGYQITVRRNSAEKEMGGGEGGRGQREREKLMGKNKYMHVIKLMLANQHTV